MPIVLFFLTRRVDSGQSQLLLVGCENDTEISIVPSQSVTLPQNLQSSNSSNLISLETENFYNGTVHQMQTVLVSSNGDLTGTKIVSNKPLSVIAGHRCRNAAFFFFCEPFAIQVPPSLTWGNTFLLAGFGGRDTDTVFKLVSAKMTDIVISCEQTLTLENITNFQFSASASAYCFVRSTQPILLTQFATSGNGIGGAVALVSPVDQFVHNISFMVPEVNAFSEVYISITVSAQHFNPNSIFYDGETLNCNWNIIRGDNNNTVHGYGCNYIITNLQNSISQHLVAHSDPNGTVSVLVYAFQHTSNKGVAYLAGQRITVGFEGESLI